MDVRHSAIFSLAIVLLAGGLMSQGAGAATVRSEDGLKARFLERTPEAGRSGSVLSAPARPPFAGTVWVTPDVLGPDCPTDFARLSYVGLEYRQTWDARLDTWVNNPSHIFLADFAPGHPSVEMVVNAEFSREASASQAEHLARLLGQTPSIMRSELKEAWIHAGRGLASANVGSILVPTGFYSEAGRHIEEVLLHELAHVHLDPNLGGLVQREGWRQAQERDARFVSNYAEAFPAREDIAESYGAYAVWVASKSNESLARVADQIEATIPHRLALLQQLGPEFAPGTSACSVNVDEPPGPPESVSTRTRGKVTTISWHRPGDPRSLTHYQWRIGLSGKKMGVWREFGSASTTRLKVRSATRGVDWVVDLRACLRDSCGPAIQVSFRR